MYKRKPQPKSKKRLIIGVAIAAALLVGAGVVIYMIRSSEPSTKNTVRPTNTVDYSPPTEQEKKDTSQQKEEIIEQGSSPAPSGTLSVSIIRVGQSNPGQPLAIRALVEGTKTGSCVVTLTRAGQPTVTKTAGITFEATSASCDDANIPANDFSVSGEWTLSITAKQGTNTSNTAEQKVTITK